MSEVSKTVNEVSPRLQSLALPKEKHGNILNFIGDDNDKGDDT